MSVLLTGIGHHFPGEPIGNDYFERIPGLGVDDSWIRAHTGVSTRHWADEGGERIAEFGAHAARNALKDAGIDPSEVDVVIGTSATARPRVNPTTLGNNYMDVSLPIQRLLEAKSAFCLDIGAVACSGFLQGSVVAQGLLATTNARTALVVCAESPKNILNFGYRNSTLFGAGAGAVVWQRTDGPTGLLDSVIHTDTTHYDAFDIDETDRMMMDGTLVGQIGPELLVDAASELLTRNGLTAADVDWCLPHQGNLNLIRPFAETVGIPDGRVLLNLPRRGNTASAGMPTALSEHVEADVVRPGDLVLAVGIGRGFSWGAMLFSYKEPVADHHRRTREQTLMSSGAVA